MRTVISQDGTRIAYDEAGQGPPLILVGGALSHRAFYGAEELVALLSPTFTVINYDRRGRGDSGDTPPYAVQREVEDIEALIAAAGGKAFLYGMSSGAVLALEAASRLGAKVRKVLMYEPPLLVDESRPPVTDDYERRLRQTLAEGRRGDAVELFMTEAVGVPAEFVAQMRYGEPGEAGGNGDGMAPPAWVDLEKVAHTLPYDQAVMQGTMTGSGVLPGHWAATEAPVLVVTGGESPPFFHAGAQALVALLPEAEHRILDGQDHAVAPAAIAPLMMATFAVEPVSAV
jgi:pimeloyl-ACP methyl ester carboxylesterase